MAESYKDEVLSDAVEAAVDAINRVLQTHGLDSRGEEGLVDEIIDEVRETYYVEWEHTTRWRYIK